MKRSTLQSYLSALFMLIISSSVSGQKYIYKKIGDLCLEHSSINSFSVRNDKYNPFKLLEIQEFMPDYYQPVEAESFFKDGLRLKNSSLLGRELFSFSNDAILNVYTEYEGKNHIVLKVGSLSDREVKTEIELKGDEVQDAFITMSGVYSVIITSDDKNYYFNVFNLKSNQLDKVYKTKSNQLTSDKKVFYITDHYFIAPKIIPEDEKHIKIVLYPLSGKEKTIETEKLSFWDEHSFYSSTDGKYVFGLSNFHAYKWDASNGKLLKKEDFRKKFGRFFIKNQDADNSLYLLEKYGKDSVMLLQRDYDFNLINETYLGKANRIGPLLSNDRNLLISFSYNKIEFKRLKGAFETASIYYEKAGLSNTDISNKFGEHYLEADSLLLAYKQFTKANNSKGTSNVLKKALNKNDLDYYTSLRKNTGDNDLSVIYSEYEDHLLQNQEQAELLSFYQTTEQNKKAEELVVEFIKQGKQLVLAEQYCKDKKFQEGFNLLGAYYKEQGNIEGFEKAVDYYTLANNKPELNKLKLDAQKNISESKKIYNRYFYGFSIKLEAFNNTKDWREMKYPVSDFSNSVNGLYNQMHKIVAYTKVLEPNSAKLKSFNETFEQLTAVKNKNYRITTDLNRKLSSISKASSSAQTFMLANAYMATARDYPLTILSMLKDLPNKL